MPESGRGDQGVPDPDRLERLEVLLMEHESTLERFSELLRDQQRQITGLGNSLELLREKLSKYEEPDPRGATHEPPPHY
ncbi:MAG: SlyX family protein [Gammaproteobacteria bacterium]|nr:SlyX family protein [Gammaproteobacteria bacterium]MDE0282469.1 SlyX family protein [Gammaproteobacteria bacterium]MDE0715447.1 SlyX family protein [Gammaproteobacteria bacterium]MXX17177.1 SlyX family protein [Gammaproteobacteria bacterium]MXY65670.1 SlyX family protein [Gammaproteobacteria bacterium]